MLSADALPRHAEHAWPARTGPTGRCSAARPRSTRPRRSWRQSGARTRGPPGSCRPRRGRTGPAAPRPSTSRRARCAPSPAVTPRPVNVALRGGTFQTGGGGEGTGAGAARPRRPTGRVRPWPGRTSRAAPPGPGPRRGRPAQSAGRSLKGAGSRTVSSRIGTSSRRAVPDSCWEANFHRVCAYWTLARSRWTGAPRPGRPGPCPAPSPSGRSLAGGQRRLPAAARRSPPSLSSPAIHSAHIRSIDA